MDCRLYIFDDIAAFSDADLARALELIPRHRREKALGYVRQGDRKLSAIAALLLLRAAGDFPETVFSPTGKPRFANPAMPRFNLSHCTRAVACAVAPAEVGVDVEPYDSYDEEVAHVAFNAAEQHRVLGDPRGFAALWTVKESYLKYTGKGLSDDLPILLGDTGDARFSTYHSERGYACTLCTGEETPHPEPIFIDRKTLLYG